MSLITQECLISLKSRSNGPIKVQIVSRGLPIENTFGGSAYILDFMRYLQQADCEIEYVLLNSSPNGTIPWYIIPTYLAALANVSVQNNLQIGRILLRFNSLSEWLTAPLLLLYNRLIPEKLKDFYRSARDERKKKLGHAIALQPWDTLVTPKELAFVNSRLVRFKPNVVVANYAWLGSVFDASSFDESVLKVILTHDILHKRVADFRRMGETSELSDWNWDNESAQLSKAQVLLAIQEEEAEILKKMAPSSEVIYMPMSVICHSHDTRQVPGRCLFVGSSSPHNTHSLQWFLENVWPLVLQVAPYCSLHVCGSVCKQIQGSFSNVCLLGRVANLKPEYSTAEVCLVPILMGSGLKIKLVEALSYGRSCVSTSVGVQGLGEIAGSAVLVADTAENFAAAIHKLLTNPEQRQWMEEQARRYVSEKLSPQGVYQPFLEKIEQHIKQLPNRV
ncbi:MAG: glycosyltransferase family 4 protein [Rhizonema sp. PD37]|nr:glycosyltransferase family 4 protein [Rhizonema sp. PD37]